ncbi:MAG: hypothetical protein QXP55_00720 [Nitrososphaerales archaeon]
MASYVKIYRYICQLCGLVIEDPHPIVFVHKIKLHEKEHKKRPAGVA